MPWSWFPALGLLAGSLLTSYCLRPASAGPTLPTCLWASLAAPAPWPGDDPYPGAFCTWGTWIRAISRGASATPWDSFSLLTCKAEVAIVLRRCMGILTVMAMACLRPQPRSRPTASPGDIRSSSISPTVEPLSRPWVQAVWRRAQAAGRFPEAVLQMLLKCPSQGIAAKTLSSHV